MQNRTQKTKIYSKSMPQLHPSRGKAILLLKKVKKIKIRKSNMCTVISKMSVRNYIRSTKMKMKRRFLLICPSLYISAYILFRTLFRMNSATQELVLMTLINNKISKIIKQKLCFSISRSMFQRSMNILWSWNSLHSLFHTTHKMRNF